MMLRRTVGALVAVLLAGSPVSASPEEEACKRKKLVALAKRDFCVQQSQVKAMAGQTVDADRCAASFARRLASAERTATCRWLEHGDGTATDLNTGLQWELKTNDGSIHGGDRHFVWNDPDWSAGVFSAVDFLGWLNTNSSSDGHTSDGGCFAGKCDWRLPTIEELAGLIDPAFPDCNMPRCTTIPGETAGGLHYGQRGFGYWSSSLFVGLPGDLWVAFFESGRVIPMPIGRITPIGRHVRAVRGP